MAARQSDIPGPSGDTGEQQSLFPKDNQVSRQKIKVAFRELEKLDDRSKEINDERAAVMASLAAMGLNRHAVKAARKRTSIDNDNKLANYDRTYDWMLAIFCRDESDT